MGPSDWACPAMKVARMVGYCPAHSTSATSMASMEVPVMHPTARRDGGLVAGMVGGSMRGRGAWSERRPDNG